jgi:hypothetical protein
MKPGDLVRSIVTIDLYSTPSRVNKRISDTFIMRGTVGVLLSSPDGTWVKWLVDGRPGWSNARCLEVVG